MAITLQTPGPDGLGGAVAALRDWQDDGAPFQLHPGDLGWFWRFGEQAVSRALRIWRRDGRIVAVGLLDGHSLLRLAVAPDAQQDGALADRLATDLASPERGVLGPERVSVEAPAGAALQTVLAARGWDTDEPWTPLRRDLAPPVPDPGVRIETIEPRSAQVRVRVQRAAFANSTFTIEAWHAMSLAPTYADARCLVAFDDHDEAVAAVTVWSAGPGRPGLLEPMGVHRDHRGRGFGTAVSVAAAAALRDLGASSAAVCTPSANAAAVATYASAGFQRLAEVRDRCRAAGPADLPRGVAEL
ncbi:MAG: N-acetyltransferase [Jatrophihabitans sp.]|nr:MAG: N-acetyltransferase [Jatrophihabitans sp.]